MNKVWTLAVAFLREHPARVILTSLATIAATCMVLWVATGYDALKKSFDVWASVALGHYELSLAPISAHDSIVPQEVVEAMRADAAVATADPFWVQRAVVRGNAHPLDPTRKDRDARRMEGGPPNVRSEYTIIATPALTAPFETEGRWLDQTKPSVLAAVVRVDTAERLEVKLGDVIKVSHAKQELELTVIGIISAPTIGAGVYGVPDMLTPGSGDVFVSSTVAEQLFGKSPEVSFIGLAMQPGTDLNKFRFGWGPKLSRFATPVQFQESIEIEEKLDEAAALDNVKLQSYAATGIAMLVALLVIFCTVNMGVTERVRQFAVLRAVVLTRSQLCLLIFAEGLLLATIGFVGGLVMSWLILMVAGQWFARLLHHGATIGVQSLLLASVATFGGALLAAAIPAWRATRVRPIDAMAPRQHSSSAFVLPIPLLLVGALLVAVNPVLTFIFPPAHESQVMAYLAVGFLSTAVGFVLISPGIVALVDRLLGPLLARVLGIDPKLLASQITSNLWRTVAAATSLAVGMGLFIGVQVWGFTMLDAFIVGPWAPDAIIAFNPTGLPLEHVEQIARIPTVSAAQCLPIVVEQPRLLEDITGSAERASVTRQDNVVIVGIDPRRAFGNEQPLFEVEWAAGDRATAIAQMESGRGCLVPDHFLTESGLKVGDRFALVPPDRDDQPVTYTIAGAIRLPGWHWQTKLTGFRSRTHRAAAMVFANYPRVAEGFDRPAATHVWFNYGSRDADPDQIVAAAQSVYASALGKEVTIGASEEGPSVRIMPVEAIRNTTRRNAARWLWAISQLPLIAVVIAGIGVLNVILASVRARQWEMGVLRSIGITQSAIVRAIIAEGVMIGVVAALLSLGFGIMAGWCGCGLAQYMSFFGGLHPALNIPLPAILFGVAFVMTLAVAAAIWPAVLFGRLRPLTLLQRGRTTF